MKARMVTGKCKNCGEEITVGSMKKFAWCEKCDTEHTVAELEEQSKPKIIRGRGVSRMLAKFGERETLAAQMDEWEEQ